MATIGKVQVENPSLMVWGVPIYDYTFEEKGVDLQDLMIKITASRAAVVESEVAPMSTRMEKRNKYLEQLGNALSNVSEVQAKFASDAKGSDTQNGISNKTADILKVLNGGSSLDSGGSISKSNSEKAAQLIKTKIDRLNNDASTDMTRLQSLVDRRDESFSTATSLMQAIGDTRSGLIKNM